ncbi:MAG: hypothetical protein AMJ56_15710 [Anaerolineae bacterium SG8_19]|nr:MAG: hypothetical protein AMJ56_15710 [Anaerolineae bacterium SG8_19]HCB50162.1 hypothetical protein [Chloroflexota bacterium]
MRKDCEFYICPICFATSEEAGEHHNHEMVFCKQLPIGHVQLKPIIDLEGDLKTRAPRWFLEAVWDEAGIDYPT